MRLFEKLNRFQQIMAAISFAESNESETARAILEENKKQRKRRDVRKTPESREDNRTRLQM
ncbi:MAG: hypothetical protein R6X08_11905 [Desulfosalsimonadaceae bacterium]